MRRSVSNVINFNGTLFFLSYGKIIIEMLQYIRIDVIVQKCYFERY